VTVELSYIVFFQLNYLHICTFNMKEGAVRKKALE